MREEQLPVLRGDRVTLRPFERRDVERVAAILTEPEIAKWWQHYDSARVRAEMLDDPRAETYAIELDGATIGVLEVWEEDDPDYRHAGVDLSLDTAHLGKGLGGDALRTAVRYLFEQRGHHRVTVDPAVFNSRAIRAYEKVGFRPVGVMRDYERGPDGTWHDALLMDLLADELR